ncbi:hypothetical protein [Pseudofrankia sp. BMG5.37]|uniref:hypothetical protein n=1 Tax=Pseudofrankia sp. BMG5.37 TaxID=3050035 RepID=UPI0028940560|nr:hypothetical protein [Pseudofrankia sp. BMG5.37]MDT3438348.1 hypothetical protein [Pseudofrankia sp. BMG5.37]
MTDLFAEVLEDLDDAWMRLVRAPSERLQHRAMREALGHLYSLREYLRESEGAQNYYRRAAADPDGVVLEGLALIRGVLVHDLVRPIGPVLGDIVADIVTEMVGTLVWRTRDEMRPLPVKLTESATNPDRNARIKAYDDHVAGRAVVDTLNDARRFLGP